jgi:hypothetical protein
MIVFWCVDFDIFFRLFCDEVWFLLPSILMLVKVDPNVTYVLR